jgi:hypothetical protein
MKLNSKIFFASICLLLTTPFLVVGGLQFPYQTTRIITFSVAIAGVLGATLWRMRSEQNFSARISEIASHPVSLIYALYIGWQLIRSLPVFSAEVLWGTWFRFDGILFEAAFLCAIIAIAAWASEFEFRGMQKKLYVIFGAVALFSLVVFPILSLDRYVGLLPSGRLNGSVGNPLYLAGLILFFPLFASHFKNRMLTGVVTVVGLGFLYATGTRGAFLAALVGALVFVWESKKIQKSVRVGIISVAVIGSAVAGALVVTQKISVSRSVTIATRLEMWKSGVQELFGQPLIGFGMGEYRNNIDRGSAKLSEISYGEITDSTHSAYLDIALKGGIIALLMYVLWMAVVYRSIAGEDKALARATVVAYFALLLTSPWMAWTAVPLIFVIVQHIGRKKSLPYINYAFIVISGAVIFLSLFSAISAARGAHYLVRVSEAMAAQKFVALPEGILGTNKLLPFSSDFGVELLRLTMPTGNFAVAPSFGSYIYGSVLPVFSAVELRKLHPDSLNIAALWASSYASSGLTGEHNVWFERSLSLQKRALALSPDRPAAVFQAADSLRELGRMPEAISMLNDFAEKHPKLPEARLRHALMVDASDDVRGAFLIEQQLKKDFPDYVWKDEIKGWFTNIEARAQKLPASK